MNKPILKTKFELWDSAADYVKHGMSPIGKLLWRITSPQEYLRIHTLIKLGKFFSRGVYDSYRKVVVICLGDMRDNFLSSFSQLDRETQSQTHAEFSFGLQFYYTFIHELLHSKGVSAKTDEAGHVLDLEKYNSLDPKLKSLFDSLLRLNDSGDAFSEHPENRGGE